MSNEQKLREALLSDMDIAVLRMPVHMAFAGDMAQFQYHNRVQALLNRIKALALPPDVPETNFGKMREALQLAKDALSLALSDVNWRKDSPTQPVIHKAYNCAHEALRPAEVMTNGLTKELREALQAIANIDDTTSHSADASAALDQIGQIARQALAMPTADHLPDAGEMVVDHFPDATKMIETAVPVGDRERFEAYFAWSRQSKGANRRPNFERFEEDGTYKDDHTQLHWWTWQQALSAGDAVDAQRYRWLMNNCTLGIKQNGVGWSLNTSACVAPDCIKDVGAAIDAAMRKDNP